MAGYDERIRVWAESLLEQHGLASTRDAARATGVNHVTLHEMRRGSRVSEATIVRVARALGEDVEQSLKACGYAAGSGLKPPADLSRPRASELTYEADADARSEWMSFYDGLPPQLRDGAMRILKAYRDSVAPYDEGRTFGRRPSAAGEESTEQ